MQSLVNGELLNQPDDHKLAREYAKLCGEIDGLLYLQRLIDDVKESEEEQDV